MRREGMGIQKTNDFSTVTASVEKCWNNCLFCFPGYSPLRILQPWHYFTDSSKNWVEPPDSRVCACVHIDASHNTSDGFLRLLGHPNL